MDYKMDDNVIVLDREYQDVKNLVYYIRDLEHTGHDLRRKVYELGYVQGAILQDIGVVLENPSLLSILRAGEPLGRGIDDIYMCDTITHLSAKRDENTLMPEIEYLRMPDIDGADLLLVDSMCATGGSIRGALNILEDKKSLCGVPKTITVICAIAAEHGLNQILDNYDCNKLRLVTATMVSNIISEGIGPGLDSKGYIIKPYGDWKGRDLGDDMFGSPKNI